MAADGEIMRGDIVGGCSDMQRSGGGSVPAAGRGFVLASSSPRRRELLLEAGYIFEVCPADIDEDGFCRDGFSSEDFACGLALAKAEAVAGRFVERVVLGADTIVECGGEIIGKPVDRADAERIVRKLFSRPHRVITGVALVRFFDGTRLFEPAVTVVYPRSMSDDQVESHLDSGNWCGRAGAYGIQDNDEFVERIEGSFSNVVGLPMELVGELFGRISAGQSGTG